MNSNIAVKTSLYFMDITVHVPTQFPHLSEGVCYNMELMLRQYAPHAQHFTCMRHKHFQSVERVLLF